MRVTESQLRRIIQRALLSEARSSKDVDDAEMIRRDIKSLVQVYSSITDQDVEALEGTGFFSFINGSADYGTDRPEYAYEAYDVIRDIAPLKVAFTASEMTDVETLETQLTGWARRNAHKAIEILPDAYFALKDLISGTRKDYKKILDKSEAGPDDPLGRIAFAPARMGMPYEPDTKVEDKMSSALIYHFEGEKMLTPEMSQMIRDFMAQGLYPSMFSEPTADVVYRGMNVKGRGINWLKNLAGGKLEGEKGSISVSTEYVPREGSASWTTSKKVASEFFSTDATYHIIMHARVADNPGMFVSAEKGLYKTDFASHFSNEREAIGLGPIQIFKIDWSLSDWSVTIGGK